MPKPREREFASLKRVFIVEDHPVFREGLAQLLEYEQDLTVCGKAATVAQALRGIAKTKPDLVLVDISLPGKSGLELIRQVRSADRKVKLLVISMHDEALYAARVLRAGGDGYIMKQEDTDEIIHAVRDVLSGGIYVSEEVLSRTPRLSRKEPAPARSRLVQQLTDHELEILELLGKGKSGREIAHVLHLTANVVNSRCARMQKKLALNSTNELIRYAVLWVENEQA